MVCSTGIHGQELGISSLKELQHLCSFGVKFPVSTLTSAHGDRLVPSAKGKKMVGRHSGPRQWTTAYRRMLRTNNDPKGWQKELLCQNNYLLALKKLVSASGAAKSHADTDLVKDAQRDSEQFPTSADGRKTRRSDGWGDLGADGYFIPAFGQRKDAGNKPGWTVGMRTRLMCKPSTETIAPISRQLGMASPPCARRELAHEMAGLVTSIFNSYIKLGEAPSDWRIANALPIFKSGGRRGKKK